MELRDGQIARISGDNRVATRTVLIVPIVPGGRLQRREAVGLIGVA